MSEFNWENTLGTYGFSRKDVEQVLEAIESMDIPQELLEISDEDFEDINPIEDFADYTDKEPLSYNYNWHREDSHGRVY